MALRDDWKKTGGELGTAFKDLGKTLVKSAGKAAKKAGEWAGADDDKEEKKEEKKEEEQRGNGSFLRLSLLNVND